MRKLHQAKLHLLSARQAQTLGEGDHSDGAGLILRIRANSATFVFRFTAPSGRRREMGLGSAYRDNLKVAGECLTAARDAASEARSLLQRGTDPIEHRAGLREAAKFEIESVKAERKRQQLTLARVARDYHERVIEPRLSSKHAAQWLSSLENHIPPEIWLKPVADIEAPELLAALAAVKPHERARNVKGTGLPETLRRIRQRLDAVFEDAVFHGLCATNPAAGIRRKMREQLPRKKAGAFKALDYREAPAFMARLRQADGIAARCLEFAMLTASRTGEVIAAQWPEFDFDAGLWVVPGARMKSGEPHTVYLSPEAVRVVRAMQGFHARWVFPSSAKKDAHLSNMGMLALLDRLGVRGATTVHGLCRVCVSTWSYEQGVARPDVIEAVLAHKEADKVKAAYNRAQFAQERRALLAAWGAYLNKSALIVNLKTA